MIVIVTEVGEFEAPPHIASEFAAAKKRKNGEIDRRTSTGKRLLTWESEFRAAKLREWATS